VGKRDIEIKEIDNKANREELKDDEEG